MSSRFSHLVRAALVPLVLGAALLGAACSDEDGSEPAESTTAKATATATASAAATKATSTASGTAAASTVRVKDAWARATAGNPGENTAVYMTIENSGVADRLIAASVPASVAGRVELHVTEMQNGQMMMRPVEGWDVAANNGTLELKPQGNHVMLLGVQSQLKVGDTVPVTLRFEHAGEVRVDAPVREAGAAADTGPMPKN
jgi:copper(I)-binding protein